MNNFFFTDAPTGHLHPVFERFLFNEGRHLRTQAHEGWHTYSWINLSQQQVWAQVHFYVKGEFALSPFRAPFGSVEFAESLSPEMLFLFLAEAESKLKDKGVKKIVIKEPPQLYRPQASALLSVLLSDRGYVVTQNEISASIVVDDTEWENKISKDERYHLRRAQREQLVFRQLELTHSKEVYRFIDQCRAERGMALSMTAQQVENTLSACPHDFLLFEVCRHQERIAAAIAVRVAPHILYNFYYGHSLAAQALSPVVFLLQGQYSFCQQQGYRLFDLGTSSPENKTNFSLLNFKTQVGGRLSMKLTFEKNL
ncbi:MAG: GNAT family N-acetyltransferase [Bacteroidetes bacterium]|nr:GNAT family N-acetyltransferase [Bacteroidota bacterium]MBS1920979.1 GNAT family N-acetyltransferase [Bacteroidota bacterium]